MGLGQAGCLGSAPGWGLSNYPPGPSFSPRDLEAPSHLACPLDLHSPYSSPPTPATPLSWNLKTQPKPPLPRSLPELHPPSLTSASSDFLPPFRLKPTGGSLERHCFWQQNTQFRSHLCHIPTQASQVFREPQFIPRQMRIKNTLSRPAAERLNEITGGKPSPQMEGIL